ncbi:hypothetical protein DH2020_047342 [Rehmannia glutinosa]|uniref:Deubiquitinating enzyme MINDY-3/4 conserved domain-containing protein n=1 Tax=Rehmannia glutinosa TaxID=99300 RepID=A0ABR0U9R4_REHGL
MADQEDEELKMASRQSTPQHESPEPKRSKPLENSGVGGEASHPEESPEVRNRLLQRELMAAAAERRMSAAKSAAAAAAKNVESVKDVKIAEKRTAEVKTAAATAVKNMESVKDVNIKGLEGDSKGKGVNLEKVEGKSGISDTSLSVLEADELFLMIFGNRVSKDVLAQWSNQDTDCGHSVFVESFMKASSISVKYRFSADPETSMGLVQHEGGPCGVLAAIQAFVLKYLLFSPEASDNVAQNIPSNLSIRRVPKNESVATDIFSRLSEGQKSRALVRSMSEILFLCGRNERALIASLNISNHDFVESVNGSEDEAIAKVLRGLSVESGADLQKVLRVDTCTSRWSALQKLEALLPIFRSRMGALLFLISALLSRGLDNVQEDRDDPSQPLVTAPFGHASQMDLGGGMFVKGITTTVEVGFLTLLESLNFCKVGQYLKCPKWPIWVVGSESHYTVLFALTPKSKKKMNLKTEKHKSGERLMPKIKAEAVLLDLDKSLGGVKDSTGLMGKKVFDLYHFNGIAKSIPNGGQTSGNEIPIQRPRITKLRVSVPPRWTPEEFMADIPILSSSGTNESGGVENSYEVSKPQHAPLVDCIRTRWPRSVCSWEGDAPSIV